MADNEDEKHPDLSAGTEDTILEAAADQHDEDGDESAEDERPSRRFDPATLPLSIRNRLIGGVVIAHHVTRDVVMPADGDAALRLLAVFNGTAPRSTMDVVDPAYSSAENGWTSLDLSSLIGITWIPGDALRQNRVAFDPLVR